MPLTLAELRARLPELTLRDEYRLRRRLDAARRADGAAAIAAEIAAEIDAAERRVEYPAELPITVRKDDIAAALRDSQVVVVAGETGSGKTTQLPKICLELGRGVRGAIGHTQPRRIAARTVADRIAEELGVELGAAVGYKVRFTDRSSDDTLVKVVTDGILLAEIQNDRELLAYDTIIIDEAHERSLNIDFLLGYLKQLLPRRPDLKLIITSATIDPHRFSRHFADSGAPVPVLEVSGRTYPVEVRYRPPAEGVDQVQAICDAVDELAGEAPGDVLVFLSGEREIRDTADALRRSLPETTEVLPLYARLSAADQHKVFAPHSGQRIVLATNVAETSLTVPGIRYVVDPGTARISRYSARTKVQRLPIEAISQASADQRKGRCGRTADGICIRLYPEDDFEARPRFTEPEVQRTNLASVILQMTALGLGDVGAFPFLDPPDRRSVADGVALLHELGALEPSAEQKKRLTRIGRQLAQLPIDPRLGRMVLAAERNGCLHEVLVIAAALSIQDPRERPADKQEAADAAHRRFADPASDFMALLNLWNYVSERQDELSSSAFRRLCGAEFLHYLRVREWQDLYGQLRSILDQLGIPVPRHAAEVDPRAVVRSLLAGLLSQLGMREDTGPRGREYAGARGARFAIWPGSGLARQPPRWVVAAELVETSRLWARTVAKVEPEWAEELAGHLTVRVYSEPHWSKRRAGVVATERVTLFGLPIVVGRTVDYARIDPELSRELFLRHALVEGDWQSQHRFLAANRELLADVEELEHRVRRRGLVVGDERLFDFYDQRVPADVVSGRHFDAWWKQARRSRPDLLTFTRDMLLAECEVDTADTPDQWTQGGLRLPVAYRFEPGAPDDGVTVEVPLSALNRVRPHGFDWQVPALREELVTALIRSLPKQLRRNFVPAPDVARAVLTRLVPGQEPLVQALARELRRVSGADVPVSAFDWAKVPAHLRATFRVTDGERTIAQGKDLEQLQRRLGRTVRDVLADAARSLERHGLTGWTVGAVPRTFTAEGTNGLVGYPALVDAGDTVDLQVLPTEPEQRAAMWAGVRRLLLLGAPSPLKWVSSRLDNRAKLALTANPHGSLAALLADCSAAAADELIAEAGGPPWDAEGFTKLTDRARAELNERVLELLRGAQQVIGIWAPLTARLEAPVPAPLQPAVADLRAQVAALVGPGFVAATGRRRLADVRRYLAAAAYRLDRLPGDAARDAARMARVQAVQAELDSFTAGLPPGRREADEVRQLRWMVEELRVSLFAQSLGTPYPVSEQRIYRAMDQLA